MGKFLKVAFTVYLYKVILIVVLLSSIICFVCFLNIQNPKISVLLGGLTTGLIIVFTQLLFSWYEHREIEEIKKLGVKKILPYRTDEEFYGSIISKTKKQIWMLGNTAYRFLDHFANKERQDQKELLEALSRKVKVKILLPASDYLKAGEDKDHARIVLKRMKEIINDHPGLFESRYYDHAPAHNLVLADSECLVGPIFPNISSKNSPAIYTNADSVFAKPYIEYFDDEWKKARPCQTEN